MRRTTVKDEQGKTYGRLTVVSRAPNTRLPNGSTVVRWNCLCSCGEETVTRGADLRSGKTSSCGCYKTDGARSRVVDITGCRFGSLVVLNRARDAETSGYYETRWNTECDCGSRVVVPGPALRKGQRVRCCKDCVLYIEELSLKQHYVVYRNGAIKRNLLFALPEEEFLRLARQNCHYCGSPPTGRKKGRLKFKANGIDRLNNSEGYTVENCVPACTLCNLAKRDLTVDQFLAWISSVYAHSVTSNEMQAAA